MGQLRWWICVLFVISFNDCSRPACCAISLLLSDTELKSAWLQERKQRKTSPSKMYRYLSQDNVMTGIRGASVQGNHHKMQESGGRRDPKRDGRKVQVEEQRRVRGEKT